MRSSVPALWSQLVLLGWLSHQCLSPSCVLVKNAEESTETLFLNILHSVPH